MTLEPISVIGLGYVGLPVAVAFGLQRRVIAFDINPKRLEELRRGEDKTGECTTEELKHADLLLTDQTEDLRQASIHIIAVPTPINEAKHPDLTPLLNATATVGEILKAGDLVIYESTVYPGCTEEDCAPILEKISGLKYLAENKSAKTTEKVSAGSKPYFTLGYSPERINPGDKEHTFSTIKKVVSGSTSEALEQLAQLYDSVITAGVHRAPSIRVAEAALQLRGDAGEHQVTVDGQVVHHLGPGDRVMVDRESDPLALVRLPGQTFFNTLRRKLNWAVRSPDRA